MMQMIRSKESGEGPVILLVEDEPSDQDLMELALAKTGKPSTLIAVKDGMEALRYLQGEEPYQNSKRPHLVILDLNMPGLHGRDVLRIIKGHLDLKALPVIILSTSHDEKDILETYSLGANSYIVKPGNFEGFHKVVKLMHEYWFSAVQLVGMSDMRREHS